MEHFITYYADNSSMGDTSDVDCDLFRQWAQSKIEERYPEYDVYIDTNPSLMASDTNDEANAEEIDEYLCSLWDRCPWDWACE